MKNGQEQFGLPCGPEGSGDLLKEQLPNQTKNSLDLEDWWTMQSMLVSWILNTIEPTLRSAASYLENAKDLWQDLKERFSVANGPRIQRLKATLFECKQRGQTIVECYGKMKTLWDELLDYD